MSSVASVNDEASAVPDQEDAPERPRVTIVVSPRERFDRSLESLDSIYEHTATPFELVYVDGRSPRGVRRAIESAAADRGFTLIRRDHYLSPNEARAIGLAEVTTEFVVFVDNDLLVSPGWLDHLIACTDETGAWIVGPLYLEGDPADEVVHMAGGELGFTGEAPRRSFSTNHVHQGERLADLPAPLARRSCGFVEFHCMLVRTDAFSRVSLDQRLLSSREHLDLCLQVTAAGGGVWFEPASRVTYVTPPPVALADVPYFLLRWSDAWNEASLAHFCAKYDIDPSYTERLAIMRGRREAVFDPIHRVTRRALGQHGHRAVAKGLRVGERSLNRLVVRPRR